MPRPFAYLLWFCMAFAHAHEGHDHGLAELPTNVPVEPRVYAESEDLALVGILVKDALWIYLDERASNTPVMDARIEVEGGGAQHDARPQQPGVYTVPAGDLLHKPGRHELTFTVESARYTDLLIGSLIVAESTAGAPSARPRGMVWPLAGLAALLAIGLIWVKVAARRRTDTRAL